jgi:hypothetical protein
VPRARPDFTVEGKRELGGRRKRSGLPEGQPDIRRIPAAGPRFIDESELIYRMQHATHMGAGSTSVRVSRGTLLELERFRNAVQAKTADETIRLLLGAKRKQLIDRLYGSARGRRPYRPFLESDRLEADR